jgi:hypothetical protein
MRYKGERNWRQGPAFFAHLGGSMVITCLNVNGTVRFKECPDIVDARQTATEWLADAKKNFPNKEFLPNFYEAEPLPLTVN